MTTRSFDTMMNPPIERLLTLTGSKFRLVTVASTRARQINSYFGQLGDSPGAMVPPQVTSLALVPLHHNGATFGLLALGSPDPTRYSGEMGLAFLDLLGRLTAAA